MARSAPTLSSLPRTTRGDTPAASIGIIESDTSSSCTRPAPKRPRRDPNALARLKAAAEARGGECLDDFCAKLQAKYRFRCAHGHEWLGWGHLILVGKWCRVCANLRMRRTIDDMQAAAAQRGGRCLSTAYSGCESKLAWQCAAGHVWEAAPRNVHSRGTWCPYCARINRRKQPVELPQSLEPMLESGLETALEFALESVFGVASESSST
ncbi:zinc-ribbon domain-containing protein [Paraburkholderia flava]|uniref:zinc-ribbon domain-containing protein n=1 Tax=Paraburkholderia flava TaxID=2547393 RepID=UPI001060246B|nr:zinc-ribbon domain-containing protein [Paraburkholderia flava]